MENMEEETIDAPTVSQNDITFHPSEVIEEEFSLQKREMDLIKRALDKNKGKRKQAALELGISERTLYRKIKEYEIQ
jgi:transcriptional regulator with PAS, ATPase and Fis domain